ERAAGRSLEGNRGEADRGAPSPPASACGRAPARADQAPGARAERAREAALGLRGEALGRRADRPLGVAGLDREHAERLVTRDARITPAASACAGPSQGPGGTGSHAA